MYNTVSRIVTIVLGVLAVLTAVAYALITYVGLPTIFAVAQVIGIASAVLVAAGVVIYTFSQLSIQVKLGLIYSLGVFLVIGIFTLAVGVENAIAIGTVLGQIIASCIALYVTIKTIKLVIHLITIIVIWVITPQVKRYELPFPVLIALGIMLGLIGAYQSIPVFIAGCTFFTLGSVLTLKLN